MELLIAACRLHHKLICDGLTFCLFMILATWFSGLCYVLSEETEFHTRAHVPDKFMLSDPPMGLFDPIEVSPTIVPRNPYPVVPQSPMYPTFPSTYEPVLTGKCPENFSSISDIIEKTASDCSAPLAVLVGNVICCPQVNSLIHIFLGAYSSQSNRLVLEDAAASNCFLDIFNILAGRGANDAIPALCSVKSSNLTGGSCPVKDTSTFEKIVDTTKLLEACTTVDPLKECCRPICQPAIMEAAIQISLRGRTMFGSSTIPDSAIGIDVANDCKSVVYAWLSRNLSPDAANTAFRVLTACKVNRGCPLRFKEPSLVISACRNNTSSNTCCSALNTYISSIQKQMLITNRQAINCATLFGSILQKGGVTTNIYELCDIDLKDFSLQAYGQQGCLLRSLPTDIILDNVTGFSFTCDLSDNIDAPWPSSSSLSSLSFCAPEMSLPALPATQISGGKGIYSRGRRSLVSFLYILLSTLI